MTTIFVTGGTGNNGKAVLEQLANTDFSVRAILRDPTKAKIKAANIEYVQGDLDEPASLEPLLKGVNTAFLVTAYSQQFPVQHLHFIQAAQKSKVQHIVQLSGIGAGSDAKIQTGKWLNEAEQYLKNSELNWTILRAASFTNNFYAFTESITNSNSIAAPYGSSPETTLTLIDNRDIGAVAAKVLSKPDEHQGKVYHLTGQEQLNHMQIADIFSKVLQRRISYQPISDAKAKAGLLEWQVPEVVADSLVELWASIREAKVQTPVTTDVEGLLGRKPFTFEEFVRDHISMFK